MTPLGSHACANRFLGLLVLLAAAFGRWAAAQEHTLPEGELRLFLALAELSREAYDDGAEGLSVTPSGCVALVREVGRGAVVIAFRGSMLADRDPDRKPFSNLGGKVVRRNYRDWVATNLKQVAGFLPRQYLEAAEVVREQIRLHPDATRIYVTGHSKGGGAAEYAAVDAWLALGAKSEGQPRIVAVTFNAAVVRERNWRRLYRTHSAEAVRKLREGRAPDSVAVVMRDDPVSKIAAREREDFTRIVELEPSRQLSAGEQHGIDVVIEELKRLLGERGGE